MIIGIGTDIVRVARIKKIVEKSETKFIDRILTPKERDKISGLDKTKALSKIYASKEALSKALGTGISGGVSFLDFEIFNDQFGAPKVILSGVAKRIFDEKAAKYVHLSISDEKDYAVAFAVIGR